MLTRKAQPARGVLRAQNRTHADVCAWSKQPIDSTHLDNALSGRTYPRRELIDALVAITGVSAELLFEPALLEGSRYPTRKIWACAEGGRRAR